MRPSRDLNVRLAPFLDAGLLSSVPTWWQVRQGELALWPWVISTDVTEEDRYRGAPLGHPLLRQPVVMSRAGLDHLRIGTGLGARLDAVCAHLHFTYHRGMPAWDLQLVQTHPGGLAVLRERTEALLADDTSRARRALGWILPDASAYLRQFLGADGWIAQAERMAYPTPAEAGAPVPERFFSLVGFARWAQRDLPPRVADLPVRRLPGHVAGLATERFRSRGGLGWFS